MGRPSLHRITRDHPSPRFRGKVRLHQFVHPNDDSWYVQILIDGKWTPRNPVALRTNDFDEACERARDKYAIATTGQKITVSRASAKPSQHEHAFKIFVDRAVAKLRQQAMESDADVKGKGHSFYDLSRRIDSDLLPRWGATPITAITDHVLNDWVADDYRVEDVAATVAKYGRQPRGEGRQVIYKRPAATTLGNLDWAFSCVWDEAVADRVVNRRSRPVIDKSIGEDTEPRAFIDEIGVQAVARVMTNKWVSATNGHGTPMKRMLRTYIAMIACTGIRAGLEAKRVRVGDVRFVIQQGRPVIFIRVLKNQGKHPKPRSVVVFEGNTFPVRRLLANHIDWRRSQGATDTDYLFAWPDGSFPTFRDGLDTVLAEANALTDPMTGEKRVAYSFRHYFATLLIERGLSVPHIAAWLGTSSNMVERHYNRILTERDAHLVNGAKPEPDSHIDDDGTPWHWDPDLGEHGEWTPG